MPPVLYHCKGARSLRAVWCLEEMGLDYQLETLPFPPRVFQKEFLELNPLGTIPFFVDGDTKMTESSGICNYLVDRYGPTSLKVDVNDPEYGAYLNWLYYSDATLTFPQTLFLPLHPGLSLRNAGYRRWPTTTRSGSGVVFVRLRTQQLIESSYAAVGSQSLTFVSATVCTWLSPLALMSSRRTPLGIGRD